MKSYSSSSILDGLEARVLLSFSSLFIDFNILVLRFTFTISCLSKFFVLIFSNFDVLWWSTQVFLGSGYCDCMPQLLMSRNGILTGNKFLELLEYLKSLAVMWKSAWFSVLISTLMGKSLNLIGASSIFGPNSEYVRSSCQSSFVFMPVFDKIGSNTLILGSKTYVAPSNPSSFSYLLLL